MDHRGLAGFYSICSVNGHLGSDVERTNTALVTVSGTHMWWDVVLEWLQQHRCRTKGLLPADSLILEARIYGKSNKLPKAEKTLCAD